MRIPRPNLPVVPSQRAAWLIAALAPVALVIAAALPQFWFAAPAFAVLVIVLVVLDGLIAGPCEEWDIDAPVDTEVGAKTAIGVHARFAHRAIGTPEAAMACDPRLAEGGTVRLRLEREPDTRAHGGFAHAVPVRRGTAKITRAWLRWSGPLGLGMRQQARDFDKEVRIWPNLAPVRSPALQTFLRDAQIGLIARRVRGEGTQFEALSEYEAGMDRRRIDWKASARHNHLYARENESERNNQIVFAFDCGSAMCEPVDGMSRLDRAITAALTCSYVALKGSDRVALFGFAQRPQVFTPFAAETRAFPQLQAAAASLDYAAAEPNFTLALATLTTRLHRRSLIVLFSDFTDSTAAELMIESIGRLVERHLVIFVTISDSELEDFAARPPDDLAALARSVTADTLLAQRNLVLQRLRGLGVDVIEAPHEAIGYELIDRYLAIRSREAIG
ncbi:MAG: DUF58 domain-containing protein [Erythrobacter sp.]|uniref:DUF58 domain-containing protein n=1 Tax=Erythrobacter sp. TaxID=1042 RepID=UPI003C781C2D